MFNAVQCHECKGSNVFVYTSEAVLYLAAHVIGNGLNGANLFGITSRACPTTPTYILYTLTLNLAKLLRIGKQLLVDTTSIPHFEAPQWREMNLIYHVSTII